VQATLGPEQVASARLLPAASEGAAKDKAEREEVTTS
jgi:hypothetical protein